MTDEAAFVSYPVLVGELEAERDAFRTDNQRLRAALTEIMAMSEPAGYGERSKSQIRDVARRALDRGNGA